LLRYLATEEVKFIEQAPDGILMLAEEGEFTVQSRSFFAVFESAENGALSPANGRWEPCRSQRPCTKMA